MGRVAFTLAVGVLALRAGPSLAADSVMLQCGRDYQAARAAGTLNGMDWTAFRIACADRLKGAAVQPAAAPAAAAVVSPPPAPAQGAPAPASPGLAAMHARQKQCGSEWRAGKAALVAATPGLVWPKFWSQCNARLKAAGG